MTVDWADGGDWQPPTGGRIGNCFLVFILFEILCFVQVNAYFITPMGQEETLSAQCQLCQQEVMGQLRGSITG